MEITESTKIQWADYVPAVSSEPLNTYYQRQNAQSYGATGYSFVLKSPSINAFMDPEVYIRFRFVIRDNGLLSIAGMYKNRAYSGNVVNNALAAVDTILPGVGNISNSGIVPGEIRRFSFRGGNIFQRATQQIAATINGWTLSYEPWKWIDPLNRLYVSNSQSLHIFSGSGGALDSGNHGNLSAIDNYYYGSYDVTGGNTTGSYVTVSPGNPAQFAAVRFRVKIIDCLGFNIPYGIGTTTGAGGTLPGDASRTSTLLNTEVGTTLSDSIGITALKKFPPHPKFYNPGLTERQYCMFRWIRGDSRGETQNSVAANAGQAPNLAANASAMYKGSFDDLVVDSQRQKYAFEIYEPLPVPLFKMYHNDGVAGIIPHVRDLQIVATFSPNMLSNIFRTNYDITDVLYGFSLDWTNITTSDCEIMIKWYTPPMNLSIPREISLPLRKIDLYLGGPLNVTQMVGTQIKSGSTRVSQYNISIDAVPDLFMIFVRRKLDNIGADEPDDFYFEITNLVIQLENNGGKATQIHTYQMYQNWLKYAKHRDPVEMDYDEWRKFCCVALLKPEDYGIIRGPGYDNYIVLGITCDTYNWHNAPTFNTMGTSELFNVDNNNAELTVISIFDRWAITLSDLGQAKAGLTRIRENNPPSLPGGVIPA